ncbi:MAG: hypothetical protein VW643_00405 [Opitutales bacterium]
MQYGISKQQLLVTLEANEDQTDKEGYAVKFSSGKAALQTSQTATDTVGVITDGAAAGSKSSVALAGIDAVIYVKLHSTAGTVNAGTFLGTHTDGTWKATASSKNFAAQALESGSNSAMIKARLLDVSGVTA